jgi:hypothetical protein
MGTNATNPADGERRALAGYVPQYTLAACIVLRALSKRLLEWIRVTDPDAGRVDDFQLGTHNRTDAYQVKWSTYPGALTWAELTQGAGKRPCLIRQLADGWLRLRRQRPNHRIVVHLVTNDQPSCNDQLPIDEASVRQGHLAAFLAQAWEPWRRDADESFEGVQDPWRHTLEQLRSATGLSSQDFMQFAGDCELDFGASIPSPWAPSTGEGFVSVDEVEHIRSRLFEAVRSPAQIIEMRRDDLLEALGWTDHFSLRRGHEFPVDYRLYQPITETVDAVNNRIDALARGYLAVLGGPGSGKSTLLTHLLRERPDRIIKYYAFIPGTGEALKPRGESESFLHDLVCQIADAGFAADSMGQVPKDRLALQTALNEQLRLLGRSYADTGLKTIVLVDGLDHVPREYQPDRSFLRDLPLPSEIPEGVLFVLGSQTDQLDDLSPDLRQSIQGHDRRVDVGRLSRPSVHELAERVLPGQLTSEQKDTVFDTCDGHPLALRYLLNALGGSQDVAKVLDEAASFEGSIGPSYSTYWLELSRIAPEAAKLLALLSRMRQPIHMRWVLQWAGDECIQDLGHRAGQYFCRDSSQRWTFFHNSFRQYVQRASATDALGEYDSSLDLALHGRLAELYAENGIEYRHRLEELYHRSMQQNDAAVLEVCQQSFFRDAAWAGLPGERILEAIHLGIEAASRQQNARALVRMALALKEVHQRSEEEDESTYIDLLIGLEDFDGALDYIRDGSRLLAAPSTALKCSLALLEAGRDTEARSLFDLAEPLDVLAKRVRADTFSPFYDRDGLSTWAAVAVHFRTSEEVLGLIDRLDSDPPPERSQMTQEEFLRLVRNQLRLDVGEELLDMQEWDSFRLTREVLEPGHPEDFPYWLRLTLDAVQQARRAGDNDAAASEISLLLSVATPGECDGITRTAIGQCILRSGEDVATVREWVADVEQPAMVTQLFSQRESGLAPWRQRLRLNALLYALDDTHPTPSELIPDTGNLRDTGSILFERAICQLARCRGRRWRGAPLHRIDVNQELLGLMRLFNRDWRKTRDWTEWHSIQAARGAFYEELVAEISQHESGCLQQLLALFEKEWSGTYARYWPLDVIRRVVLRAYDAGMPRYWATRHLENIDRKVADLDVNGRVQHYSSQAEAWLAVGEASRVRECIQRIRQASVGVGYRKDYQANVWIRHLREHLGSQPDDASRLLPWMACAVASLEDTTESGAREAAPELIQVAFEHSPRNAVRLVQWFGGTRIRWWHEAGLAALIRSAAEFPLKAKALLLSVAVDLYMPLATYPDAEDVPLSIGRYLLSRSPNEQSAQVLDTIVAASDVMALDVTRACWRHGLDLALERSGHERRYSSDAPEDSDLGASVAPDAIATPEQELLRMKSGEQISRAKAAERCSTFDGLLTVLSEVEDICLYMLEPLLRPKLADMSREQLLRLAEVIRTNNRNELLLAIGYRLQALGDSDVARCLAEEVLESPYRFSQEWRGQQNESSAIELLKTIDGEYAKGVAYRAIAREMQQHSFTGYQVATRIPDVLRLLQSNMDLEEFWPEIEEHLNAIFDKDDMERIQAAEWALDVGDDTPEQALVDVLMTHATHPCNHVRLGAMRGLARAVKAGCGEAIEAVRLALGGAERQQWHLIRLAEAVSFDAPESTGSWKAVISGLGAHPNYAIRRMARSICDRLGWTPATPAGRELPVAYRLWLPDDASGAPLVGVTPASGQVRPDTENPEAMISPFDLNARMLAQMADIQPNAVYARIASLMRQIEPFSEWCAEAEKQWLEELRTVGPQFTYTRPRAHVARRALFIAAAELVDARCISREDQDVFFRPARPHDPSLLLQTGCRRPGGLVVPEEREYPQNLDEWRAQSDLSRCVRELDGLVVLGEDSLFKSLGDDHLKERRQSIVMPESWLNESTGTSVGLWHRLHETILGGTVGNYPGLRDVPRGIVLANRLDGCNSPGCDWLAVNPSMAAHFGWVFDPSTQWFAWHDGDGIRVARSLWWQDGLVGYCSRTLHSWVSEGWLVLASPSVVLLIEQEVGSLCRVKCVTRAAGHDDQGITARSVTPLSSRT